MKGSITIKTVAIKDVRGIVHGLLRRRFEGRSTVHVAFCGQLLYGATSRIRCKDPVRCLLCIGEADAEL